MKNKLFNIRILILRRLVQALIVFLFIMGNFWGWQILQGNYSAVTILNTVTLADPLAVLQILLSGFWVGTKVIFGAIIVLFVYGIFFGRAYCSWVCPVNCLTDMAAFAGNKISKHKQLSALINKNTRYWILFLTLILSIILQVSAFELINPIGLFFRAFIYGMGSSWAILLAFFIFEMAVIKNGWCSKLCPLGAFYALIGKFRIIRIKHNIDNCTKCNDCFKVCPEKHVLDIITIKSGTINNSECTNCGRCIEVCKDNALTFGIKNIKK